MQDIIKSMTEVCDELAAISETISKHRIVDSRGTCHTCNKEQMFSCLKPLSSPVNVTLGDGHTLKATGVET